MTMRRFARQIAGATCGPAPARFTQVQLRFRCVVKRHGDCWRRYRFSTAPPAEKLGEGPNRYSEPLTVLLLDQMMAERVGFAPLLVVETKNLRQSQFLRIRHIRLKS